MEADEFVNDVMTKAQTLEGEELEKFFTLMCAMSIAMLRGIHDDEFVNDFLNAAKADSLTITPQRVN